MFKLLNNHSKTTKLINNDQLNKQFKHANFDYLTQAIALDFITNKKTIFVICANLYEAQNYYDTLGQLINKEDLLFYPTDQILTTMMALGSIEFRSERLYTIQALLKNRPSVVVTTMLGVQMITLAPSDYIKGTTKLQTGDIVNIDDLAKTFVYSGYQKTFTVEFPGTFSIRGSIIDIFPINSNKPYRIDLFDNYIETIKTFAVDTQRSLDKIDSLNIMPMQELFFTDTIQTKLIDNINNTFSKERLSEQERVKLDEDIANIKDRFKLEALSYYIQFVYRDKHNILDFVIDPKIYIIDYEKAIINNDTMHEDLKTYAQTLNGNAFINNPMFLDISKIINKSHNIIDPSGFYLPNANSLGVMNVNNYRGNLELFYLDYEKTSKRKPVYIYLESKVLEEELLSFLNDKNETLQQNGGDCGFYLTKSKIVGSYEVDNFVFIEAGALFNRKLKRAIEYRSVLNQATKIRHVDELSVLDYVVHYDYGIGRYMGLKTMDLSGYKRDYLHIIYANDESLYVPMEQINLVLKYKENDANPPRLSKMGGKVWNKTKQAVRMKIKDLSDRLIKLYAKRNEAKGFEFVKDNELQRSFEADFEYGETPDQMRAIIETKHDMQTSKPMDRLICGDVGFGKTEVALRAAFKATLSQKQVLYLVPTTVLARQHYYTFKERFEKYGGSVALLNRFTRPKQQREILEKLKKGYIDVVIGTHRLLSTDVIFKDLGLLIVDEEQRFGVEHKERIKEIKVNVDALTLTATPIPRTLQMSLMGLKDLSMIETPPLNRYPVQTYVVEKEWALVKEAIGRELARGGQVFYLLNRINSMERRVLDLQNLVPEARIAYVHGKMHRDNIEDVISDFSNHEYDILVATTIIETGIDMPNTNTLIIEDADKLGLSQLYQIRGRVGRSDKIAYAYLLYDKHKHINEEAKKRLLAIEDFTALGSGYKIAIRDLSIRGAGDILGAEQSGFIDSVGPELYQKLLEEVVTGSNAFDEQKNDNTNDIQGPRHIEPEYILDEKVRIEIHKSIGNINSLNDLLDLKDELEDRFGKISVDLMLYMYEKLYKTQSHYFKIEKSSLVKDTLTITFKLEANNFLNGLGLLELANKKEYPAVLKNRSGKVLLEVDVSKSNAHWLYIITKYLDDNKSLILNMQ